MYRKCQCNIPKGSEYCRFFNYCYFFYYYYVVVVVIVDVVVFLLLKALQSWEEEEGGVCACVLWVRREQRVTRGSNWLIKGHEWSEMNSIGKLTSWVYSPLPQLVFS